MINLINRVYNDLAARLHQEEGQTLVEYGLIITLVAVVCLVSLALIGTHINTDFGKITGTGGI
jgi:pilus assembly protein Flp/PilA